jgi:hypothetical protein
MVEHRSTEAANRIERGRGADPKGIGPPWGDEGFF